MRHSIRSVVSDDALAIPIVDVTNPSFTVTITDEDLEAKAAEFVRDVPLAGEMTAPLRAALERSRLGRGVSPLPART